LNGIEILILRALEWKVTDLVPFYKPSALSGALLQKKTPLG
jgi:hypothetical protein